MKLTHLQVRNWKFIVDTEVARFGGIVEGVPCLLACLIAWGTDQPVFTHLHHWKC